MVFIAPHILWGQNTSEQPENTKAFVNLPDTPAFKALGSEPSNLLLPSKPDELSAVFSEFYQGNHFIIPKDIAFEFAPALLFKKEPITLNEFIDNQVLYTSRISIGTKRDSTGLSRLAFGLRISPIDETNLQNNRNYLSRSAKLRISAALSADSVYKAYYEAQKKDSALVKNVLNFSLAELEKESITKEESENLSKEDKVSAFERVKNLLLPDSTAYNLFVDNFNTIVERVDPDSLFIDAEARAHLDYINQFKISTEKRLWNAEIFDIAGAAVFASPDTLADNINFESITGWITYARPIGPQDSSRGQWLIGGQFGYKKNLEFANEDMAEEGITASLATRVYLGSNDAKFFTEAQWAYKKITDQSQLLCQLGGEFRLALGLWFDFSMGIETDQLDGKSGFISNATMRYSLANGFKF